MTTTLLPMTEAELTAYLETAIEAYAADHAQTDNAPLAEAVQRARAEFAQLLPDGIHSPQQHLFTVRDGDTRVGMLWFAEMERGDARQAWVYDINIDPEFRRQGHASAVFGLLEDKARELGLTRIGLHVFGHNTAAIQLYEKLGFAVKNLIMAKDLEGDAD